METTPHKVNISHSDRLGMTLFLAVMLHALIILGISFSSDKGKDPDILSRLDITLVQHKSEKAPEKADYLAQANQKGSGNTKEKVRHQTVRSKASPDNSQGQADLSVAKSIRKPTPEGQVKILTQARSKQKIYSRHKEQKIKNIRKVSAEELVRRSKEIARLSAQNDASWKAYSQLPDSKYLYANTRSHVDAAYLAAWTQKVKKIGNLNYPYKARKKNLSGNLMIEVTLHPNGSLVSIRILQSSKHKVLDNAAINIVKLAAPFAAVPAEVLQGRKVLRIVRTWLFTTDNRLHSR